MSERFKNLKTTDLGVVAIVAGLYFLAAKLGLSLAFLNASVSPVWPPTGVAIALVFWLGYRSAPGVLLGALIANYFLTDVSLATAAGISIGNMLEATTAVYLVRRFVGSGSPFNRAIDVLKFGGILSAKFTAQQRKQQQRREDRQGNRTSSITLGLIGFRVAEDSGAGESNHLLCGFARAVLYEEVISRKDAKARDSTATLEPTAPGLFS